jgi:hypothetical protein
MGAGRAGVGGDIRGGQTCLFELLLQTAEPRRGFGAAPVLLLRGDEIRAGGGDGAAIAGERGSVFTEQVFVLGGVRLQENVARTHADGAGAAFLAIAAAQEEADARVRVGVGRVALARGAAADAYGEAARCEQLLLQV